MIPLSTTAITVTRSGTPVDTDPYDPGPTLTTTIATGVRAVISAPSANSALSGGDRVVYAARLTCDPCDIRADDQVADTAGTLWTVLWARRVTAVGLDFMEGQLRLIEGAT